MDQVNFGWGACLVKAQHNNDNDLTISYEWHNNITNTYNTQDNQL